MGPPGESTGGFCRKGNGAVRFLRHAQKMNIAIDCPVPQREKEQTSKAFICRVDAL
jgi:hypothetical protein